MTPRLTLRQVRRLCELEQHGDEYSHAVDLELDDLGLVIADSYTDANGDTLTELSEHGRRVLDQLATEAGAGSMVRP